MITSIICFIFAAVFFAYALCRVASKPAPKPTKCLELYQGRMHLCNSDGRSYANGRPTMPSEAEPELERERRTR
jgi:hypothetical protein